MSSGEEFEVESILDQRKRKGAAEYLVRWQGFSELYDSWEPVSTLQTCKAAIEAFLSKKRARSKSRSTSRGRGRPSKSKSRSRSRGRPAKAATSPASPVKPRSRSRSASRQTTQVTAARTALKAVSKTEVSQKSVADVQVAKKSVVKEESSRGRSRSRTRASEVKASTSKSEAVTEKASVSLEGGILQRKTEVVKTSVETIRSVPSTTIQQSEAMTTRSRLAVSQVDNDQKAAPAPSAPVGKGSKEGRETWMWWFADHAVLILFILISLIALSFTIEGFSGVRDQVVPDFGLLRQRLGESYRHGVDALAHGFNTVLEVLPTWGQSSASPSASTSPPPPKAVPSRKA